MKSSTILGAAVLACIMVSAAPAAPAPTPGSAAKVQASAGSTRFVVPFQDDYAKAVAEARARKVPLFVEAWAPW